MTDTAIEEQIGLSAEAVLALERPAFLVRNILNYALHTCHRRWFRFQLDHNRTLILAPRGHGKSTISTISFAIWKVLNDPNLRVFILSNTDTQATSFLAEIKAQLESDAVKSRFGDLQGEYWGKHKLTLKTRTRIAKEATFTATGIGGPVISGHYDIIIVDDPVDEENAESEVLRQKVKKWYKKTLLPCLEPNGEIHVLGTRYHPIDLYQSLIDLSDEEKRAQLEDEEVEDPYEILIDGAFQQNDSVLCPELYPRGKLLQRKREMGSILFNMQYQNDVELAKGAVFKPEWIQYCKYGIVEEALKKGAVVTQAYDLAISTKTKADYFAGVTVAGVQEEGTYRFYVIDAFHKKAMSFDEQQIYIVQNARSFNPDRIGIEDVAYQAAMRQTIEGKGLPVEGITPVKDKVSRAYSLAAYFENKQVFFLKTEPIMELVDELLLFPDGGNDDLFDSLEMAVKMQASGLAPRILSIAAEEKKEEEETGERFEDIGPPEHEGKEESEDEQFDRIMENEEAWD